MTSNRDELDSATTPQSRGRLVAAAALAVAWLLTLVGLAIWTANPITLNRVQIINSDHIASGQVIQIAPDESGIAKVENVWDNSGLAGNVTIENLGQANAKVGATYLIPLTKVDGERFRITEIPSQGDSPPLIYPAATEAIRQLELILRPEMR